MATGVGKNMKFPRWLVIVLIVAVVVGGAYLHFVAPSSATPSTANLTTATVTRGTLTATVNSAGNITAEQAVALNFQQAGTVQEIGVKVGDRVKAGQVMAKLAATNLQLQVQNAQLSLRQAEDQLWQAQNPNLPQDIDNARVAVVSAQAAYDKLATPPLASAVAAAKAQVASAQAAYDAAVRTASTSGNQLDASAQAVAAAQKALQSAQFSYDREVASLGGADPSQTSQAEALQQANADYQSAVTSYQQLQATAPSSANSTVQQALSTLASAQANLYTVENPTTQDNLKSSLDAVTQAKDTLANLLAEPDVPTVDVAQQAVETAKIALAQDQLYLQQAEVIAPFDGTVYGVNITLGQDTSTISGGAIQLADLADLQITVDLAEVDVDQIHVSQNVQISLDALPDATVSGTVALVYPAGTMTSGVVNYPVTIDLVNPPAGVLVGMTANVNIVTQEKDNVLMVPIRAVKTFASTSSGAASGTPASATSTPGQSGASSGQNGANSGRGGQGGTPGAGRRNGTPTPSQKGSATPTSSRQYVIVLEAGQQVQVPVVTGISNDTMTEIVSGLQEGDTVVVNGATTSTTTGGGGGFRMPGLGRF